MKKRFLVVLTVVLLFSYSNVFSQKKELEIKKLQDREYYPKRQVYDMKFVGSTDSYSYLDKDYNLIIVDKKGNVKQVNVEGLNKGDLYGIEYVSDNEFVFLKDNNLYKYNINKNTKTLVTKTDTNAQFIETNYKSGNMAFIKDNNVFVSSSNGTTKQLTTDGDSINIIYGQAVHRNEFGINKGFFFAPSGNYLAYYRMDQSMVGDYPLVNTQTREATVKMIKYPMAGMKSHEVLVYVYNFLSGKTVMLQTRKDTSLSEREMYLTNITFSPNGKIVYIQKLNRLQNHLWLESYDSETGKLIKVLFEETSSKYVEPETPIVFVPNTNDDFLFMSERDSWNHIYLYDKEGKMKKQITKGNWMVNEIVGFNDKGNMVYFYATKDSPLDRNLYSVDLNTLSITRLTPNSGYHTVSINSKGTLFADSYSNYDSTPHRSVILNDKHKVVKELDFSNDPFKEMNEPTITIDTLHAEDGTVLYTRMIRPKDFNPNKKYPVITYVYGGPHEQLITNTWTAGAGNFLLFLASKGYIVWTMDSRGSANRGYDFESAIWHNCGTREVKDQMIGINHLKTLPYVDTTRMGVDGWSYGGFMTISMKLRNPGVFKVATAGGPVVDWKWYEVMYGERYMGTPQNNPEGFKNASLLNYIDNLQGKLLIMQGYQDNTVVPQHSLEFIRNCVKKNKPVDYFIYTEHEHNVRGKDRIHLYEKIYQYYQDNL